MRAPAILAIAVAMSAAMATSASAQDAAKGKTVAAQCATCHQLAADVAVPPGGTVGPPLIGVVGRASASVRGFRYSRAMQNAKVTWTAETLDTFLADPQKLVPGNVMPFAGIQNASLRADLIAYLKTLTPPKAATNP